MAHRLRRWTNIKPTLGHVSCLLVALYFLALIKVLFRWRRAGVGWGGWGDADSGFSRWARIAVLFFTNHEAILIMYACLWVILLHLDLAESHILMLGIFVSILWNAVAGRDTVLNGSSAKTKLYKTSSPVHNCFSYSVKTMEEKLFSFTE